MQWKIISVHTECLTCSEWVPCAALQWQVWPSMWGLECLAHQSLDSCPTLSWSVCSWKFSFHQVCLCILVCFVYLAQTVKKLSCMLLNNWSISWIYIGQVLKRWLPYSYITCSKVAANITFWVQHSLPWCLMFALFHVWTFVFRCWEDLLQTSCINLIKTQATWKMFAVKLYYSVCNRISLVEVISPSQERIALVNVFPSKYCYILGCVFYIKPQHR